MRFEGRQFHEPWHELVKYLVGAGAVSAPRGLPIREQLNVSLQVTHPLANILYNPVRNLGYRAMVAEWLWIAGGYGDVASIARYNKNMTKYSDDGKSLYGAYGPRIRRNWLEVKQQLVQDSASRQAVLPIWGPSTRRDTKDTPCTISLQFLVRNAKVHLIVNMRSSDVWLGLPNDFYVFSQLQNEMAMELLYEVGTLTMNFGSSHLYEENMLAAKQALEIPSQTVRSPHLPETIPEALFDRFERQSDETITMGGETIWDYYAKVLGAKDRATAFNLLKKMTHLRTD